MEETKELVEQLKYFKEELDKMNLRNEAKEHMLMLFYEKKLED